MEIATREHRDNIGAGLVGAAALHVVVAGLLIYFAPKAGEDRVIVNSVPVTIVADAIPTAPVIAPGPPAEAIPEPVEQIAPPEPAPPPPPAKAQPTPKPPKPSVNPRQRPAEPRPNLDLDDLASDPTLTARNRPARPQPPKANPRPPTAPPGGAQVRGALSPAGRADAMAAIVEQVEPNWNLNCNAPDLDTVKPVIRFRLNAEGRIVGDPQIMGGASAANARLAVQAMKASDPFRNVPPELVGPWLQLRFNAAKACRGR